MTSIGPPTTRRPPRSSNFLVALQESAAEGSSSHGRRGRLGCSPLVLRTAANWSERGADALTGPIARGDEETVERHLEALRERAPELVGLYEALADRTREIAARRAARTSKPDERRAHEGGPAGRPEPAGGQAHQIGRLQGALHGGHLSLLDAARARYDVVVMSLFVNPAVRAGEDLHAYPRDEARDLELRRRARGRRRLRPESGGDLPGRVRDRGRGHGRAHDVLEGDSEHQGAGHFRGVTTVVAKLFASVGPDVAFFGQKDAQQVTVIRRMARDLDFPVEIAGAGRAGAGRPCVELAQRIPRPRGPTPGGGASPRARRGRGGGRRRDHLDAEVLAAARAELEAEGIEPDYLERDPDGFLPVESFNGRPVRVAVAARVGPARLIDNVVIREPAGTHRRRSEGGSDDSAHTHDRSRTGDGAATGRDEASQRSRS